MYLKFMGALGAGLFGLGMVMMIVIDELFMDWDGLAAMMEWARERFTHSGRLMRHQRAEDMLLEIEKSKAYDPSNLRLVDQRREALRELASVENRLRGPQNQGPIVLTPLAPPPEAAAQAQ